MTTSLPPSQPWRQKWGDDFFATRGYTQLPNALLEFAPKLHLKARHIAVIAAILYWKWDDRDPYPSIHTIASASGTSNRTVQRALRELERWHLLIIRPAASGPNGRQTQNTFDFRPLRLAINKLQRLGLPVWARDRFSAQRRLLDPDDPEA